MDFQTSAMVIKLNDLYETFAMCFLTKSKAEGIQCFEEYLATLDNFTYIN